MSASEGTYFNQMAYRGLEDQLRIVIGDFFGYFPEMTYAVTGLNLKTGFLELVFPTLIAWGAIVSLCQGDRLLVPFTVIQFCGFLLSYPGERYLLPLLPGLFLFLGVGLLDVANRISARFEKKLNSGKLVLIVFIILAVLNVGHNFVPIAQARMSLEAQGAESSRSLPFFIASRWLKEHAPDAKVLTKRSRIIHYLTGCRTVALIRSGVPQQDTIVADQSRLKALISESKPNFLFLDDKDTELCLHVFQAVADLGLTLKEIPAAGSAPRYALFEILPSTNPDE